MSQVSYTDPQMAGSVKREIPEWILNQKRSGKPVRGSSVRSCYQMDVGKAGETPQLRPYTIRNGMAGTTADLFTGTTKDNYHLPGYSGFIPQSKRNPTVANQGLAKGCRPANSSLRLYYDHNLPGYTGHRPNAAGNDFGVRASGSNMHTTSGAASLGLLL